LSIHPSLTRPKMVAIVQKPAPTFNAPAVVDGIFTDINLADYLGQWCVVIQVITCGLL
jgi:alkyl hydroperoxide reductase subunit AhpC